MPHKKPERAEGEEDEENGGELNFEILIKVNVNCHIRGDNFHSLSLLDQILAAEFLSKNFGGEN